MSQKSGRKPYGKKVSKEAANLLSERVEELKRLFPAVVSEGKIDWDKLRAILGGEMDERPERYSFSWAGKRDAIRLLQTPSRATLVPCEKESVNFDATQNLFIEGDNLEVLKLLYKPYFGRVKIIYIDPPYNTGTDFIYPDNFVDPLDNYLRLTKQMSDEGNLLTSNPETSGRYHSTWLSMMYPRLFLARQLLREDGIIFVSIDDHEAQNLRLMMNELYGEENFVAQLLWEKGRKNDAKLFSVGHEYIVVFAKSKAWLNQNEVRWREAKPGAEEIQTEYLRLKKKFGSKTSIIQKELREFYANLPKNHPSKKHSRYSNVDESGVWRDDNMSWPGGGGPTYDVIHPRTKKACAVPEGGWRYSTPEKMQEMIAKGRVVFRADHTEPPIRKTYLVRENGETEEDDDADTAIQVAGTYFYRSALQASNLMLDLFGRKVFENPKDHEVLMRLFRYVGGVSNGDIILDFFAGSATTAHSVLEMNREDRGKWRFILVQLPEPVDETTEAGRNAAKLKLMTIAEIGKERIRRVIKSMGNEKKKEATEDLGFKVFKLTESNYRPWSGVEEKDADSYGKAMELFADPLREKWKTENVIYEVAIKEGYGLNCRIERVKEVKENAVFRVTDPDKEQSFFICLDEKVRLKTLQPLAFKGEDLFICRDVALDDSTAANLALQCNLKTI